MKIIKNILAIVIMLISISIPSIKSNLIKVIENHNYYLESLKNSILLKKGIYQNNNIKISLAKYNILTKEENSSNNNIAVLVFLYQNGDKKIFELTSLIYNKERKIDRQLNNIIFADKECYIEELKIFEETSGFIPSSYLVVSIEIYQNQKTINKKYIIDDWQIKEYSEKNIPIVKKPAIYLYPPTKTKITLELKINGNILKTIPYYNGKWEVVADNKGNIYYNSKKFEYLFYENTLNIKIPQSSDYYIISYEKLYLLRLLLLNKGLTKKEINDFYTYLQTELGKKKNKHKFYKITFLDKKFLNKNMNIKITPTPDNFIRVILRLQGFDNPDVTPDFSKKINKIPTVSHPPLRNSNKFNVVEWGTIIENLSN